MALNIFPRRDNQRSEAPKEDAEPGPPPQIEAPAQDDNAPRDDSSATASTSSSGRRSSTRTRRTTASRSRSTATEKSEEDGKSEEEETQSGSRKSASSSRRGSSRKTAEADTEEGDDSTKSTRSRTTRSRSRKTETETQDETPAEDEKKTTSSRSRSTKSTAKSTPATAEPAVDLAPLVKAIEQQGKQIEALSRAIQDGQGQQDRRSYAPPARVGVFVDVANVELGADRAKMRLDWGRVLNFLGRDRQLVRAIAYAPVHDDPEVSRETQRFVEPFLDKGYKIITKPLKRFSDGTIKANVDIELALDVMNMLERLDVVCLVSGDGDFEPLVKSAQDRGVRVEVVALSNSCSNNLRDLSDAFIDLQSRANEVRAR